ncbi:MAG: tetratricopeptide repeat protein [Muribaculaceae bacterium]|jgi:tetratricopeptide (TPR) repeat protein|nr:tetratricopeptide repeat protein [Muribaculaceae bacterium]
MSSINFGSFIHRAAMMVSHRQLCAACCVLVGASAFSQIVRQPGIVRELSYSASSAVVPIENVSVKVQTEERSDAKGRFTLRIPASASRTFSFSEISKKGYVLISPSLQELPMKYYPLNPKATVQIIMAKRSALTSEKNRIAANIRSEFMGSIRRLSETIDKKNAEIAKMRAMFADTAALVASRDSIQKRLTELRAGYADMNDYVASEADRLSKIDYRTLDSIGIRNTELLKAGKGDEMVRFNKALLPSHGAEIAGNISSYIGRKKAELEKKKKLRDFIAARYKDISDGYKMEYNNDSAVAYMQKRVQLNPENDSYFGDLCSLLNYSGKYAATIELADKFFADNNMSDSLAGIFRAKILSDVAVAYEASGDYTKALDYLTRSSDISRRIEGENSEQAAIDLTNLCVLYGDMDEYQKAIDAGNKSVGIFITLGIEDDFTSAAYNAVATVYITYSQYSEGIAALNEAIRIDSLIFGSDNVELASYYNNLGNCYVNMGEFDKAAFYLNKSLDLRIQALGGMHPDVARSYVNLANMYFSMDSCRLSADCLLKAIKIRKENFGVEDITYNAYLSNLSAVYYQAKQYREALDYANQVLAFRMGNLKENSSGLASSYNILGSIYTKLGEFEKAVYYCTKCVTADRAIYGDRNDNVAYDYLNLLMTCQQMKQPAQLSDTARAYLDSAVNVCLFMAVISSNGAAKLAGMDGEYAILEFNGWNCTNFNGLRDAIKTGEDHNRVLVAMDSNGEITQHEFGPGSIGLIFKMKNVGAEAKQAVVKKYLVWKKHIKSDKK